MRSRPLLARGILAGALAAGLLAMAAPARRAHGAAPPAVVAALAAPRDSAVRSLAPADTARDSAAVTARDSLAHGSPAPPPRDYLAEARAGYGPLNRAYASTRVVLQLLGPLYGILCGLLLMFTGVSARFRDIAHGLGHRRYVRVLVYFSLYAVTMFVLGLPLAWFEEFALEHQYGLSTQSFGGWLIDSLKGLVLSITLVGVVPLLALAWYAIEHSPKRWWLWISAGAVPLALAFTLLEPVLLDPLFNKFTPLHDTALRADILALGARAGIPAHDVYQVDMSARTRKLNAYVNGFGASQRIVLWDTTLKRMKRDEILFVMGHEMGHYVLGHVWSGLGALVMAFFVVLGLGAMLAGLCLKWFGRQWGVTEVRDLAALPALLLSLTLVTLLALPAINALSRRVEHEADIFGLEITHDNDAAARSFLALAQGNRSDPEPPAWIRIVLFDHPPLGERIRFALGYRPWEQGRPNRFYHGR